MADTLLAELAGPDRETLLRELNARPKYQEKVNTVAASGASVTLPHTTVASINDVTLTAACTFVFPTATAPVTMDGRSLMLVLRQDATGSRLATWPATVKWAGGTAPTLSTAAGKVDVLTFTCVDGTNWFGFTAGLDIR